MDCLIEQGLGLCGTGVPGGCFCSEMWLPPGEEFGRVWGNEEREEAIV